MLTAAATARCSTAPSMPSIGAAFTTWCCQWPEYQSNATRCQVLSRSSGGDVPAPAGLHSTFIGWRWPVRDHRTRPNLHRPMCAPVAGLTGIEQFTQRPPASRRAAPACGSPGSSST
eukprot:2539816-Prymnesium_polylepis.2